MDTKDGTDAEFEGTTREQGLSLRMQLISAKTKKEKAEIAMKLWGVTKERAEEIADRLLSV